MKNKNNSKRITFVCDSFCLFNIRKYKKAILFIFIKYAIIGIGDEDARINKKSSRIYS